MELYLSDNQLAELPPEITRLTALTTLDLDNNQLIRLPPHIAVLVNLTDLWIDENALITRPEGLTHLIDHESVLASQDPKKIAKRRTEYRQKLLSLYHSRAERLQQGIKQAQQLEKALF